MPRNTFVCIKLIITLPFYLNKYAKSSPIKTKQKYNMEKKVMNYGIRDFIHDFLNFF